MASILLHSRKGLRSQAYFKPLSNVFLFENESEKQRYNNHYKKLEELKEKLIAKPEQELMIATAVIITLALIAFSSFSSMLTKRKQ